jgi:hypothetical protein
MVARYSTPEAVLLALGLPEDHALLDQAAEALEDAEEWLDTQVGHAFGDTDSLPGEVVTDAWVTVDGPLVWLPRAPVSSLTEVAVRDGSVGATETELEDGEGYELFDASAGLLRLASWWTGQRLRVSYVVDAGPDVPRLVRRFVTLLAAHWLGPVAPVAVGAIKSISVDGDSVRADYAVPPPAGGAAGRRAVPDELLDLVRPYLRSRRRWFT